MYDARIALCDEWKSRFSFVLDWITLSRAWCATRARRSSRLAVLRPPDEKERRRPDNPDIDITCFRREEEGGAATVQCGAGQHCMVAPWSRRTHRYLPQGGACGMVPGSTVSSSDEGDAAECM